ncbi:MAG: transposase [Armatimonadetes bacterium]|nr:transposase [Armatimonadota bacterium]
MQKRDHPYVPARNRRLAAHFYGLAGQVSFITIRAYRHQSPFTVPALNRAIIDALAAERRRLGCAVHIYCLMPDHLQMLVSPREDGHSVLTFVDQFKGKTTNLSWSYGWRGKLWQPRSYDHIVRAEQDLADIAQYILSDPARTGLVEDAEEYPWRGAWDPFPV